MFGAPETALGSWTLESLTSLAGHGTTTATDTAKEVRAVEARSNVYGTHRSSDLDCTYQTQACITSQLVFIHVVRLRTTALCEVASQTHLAAKSSGPVQLIVLCWRCGCCWCRDLAFVRRPGLPVWVPPAYCGFAFDCATRQNPVLWGSLSAC